MTSPSVILAPRWMLLTHANMIKCPWQRAVALHNLGIFTAHTKKEVNWVIERERNRERKGQCPSNHSFFLPSTASR
jgi:hypothetical protein